GPIAVHGRSTRQVFEGHPKHTADIHAAVQGEPMAVTRIWCAGNTRVKIDQLSKRVDIAVALVDNENLSVPGSDGTYEINNTGWYTIRVSTAALDPVPYKLAVTYRASRKLD